MSIGSPITTNFNENNLSKEFINQFQHLTNQTTSIQSRSSKLLKSTSISIPRYDQSELQLSKQIQFRPALLTSNIHRFTISVLPIYATISYELDRLRSWKDPIRTGIWATIYTILWSYRLTFFGFLSIVLCFTISPNQTYSILFPTTTDTQTTSTTTSTTSTPTLIDSKDDLHETLPFEIPTDDFIIETDEIKLENFEESQSEESINLPNILITESNTTPIKTKDDEIHSISSLESNLPPSSIKSSDLSIDQSFNSAKSVITSSTSIKSNQTSPDSIKSKTPSSNSTKSKTPSSKSTKSTKPSSTSTQSSFLPTKYRTHVEKYGGGVQNIAAALSDGHERFLNLFKGKYVKPTTRATEPEELWISPNIRLSLIITIILMVSYFVPTEIILRSISLIIGIILFVIEPLEKRYEWISSILDPEQGILKDVPTDRAWVLYELRQIKNKQGLKGLYRVLSVLDEECHAVKAEEIKTEDVVNLNETSITLETTSLKSTPTHLSNSSTSTKSSKRIKLVNTSRKFTKFLEIGNDLLNLEKPIKLDNYINTILQPTNSSIYLNLKTKLKKQTNTIESNLSNLILREAKEIKEVKEVKEEKEKEEEEEMIRFGCCFKRLPGELKVYEEFIRFDSGFNFLNKSLNKSNSPINPSSSMNSNHSNINDSHQIQINFNQIVSIKKSSGIGITGIWGSIDGIEIEVEIESQQGLIVNEVYKFWNLNQRDLCFIFLMVLREWKESSTRFGLNSSGWISI
ncbi:uncharacterized protein MELLADRAFT_103155 [Melampsora larici-populina 98AG31]|uniref:Uncharacterized protein n=1 Tax=Melampsora larici-populina (strain 98AG31 / pathotype 3-4-7) TaxID=747676 RepID=F4RAQ6_MELLP|nr:uncharacterized protein MELLADRAFT_103155 [Melampsora larici-populina 98AG31]EGG10741.1 hypothetical protein MELLADRAFT_103155 [Melampsora larici-populina 98AG31]